MIKCIKEVRKHNYLFCYDCFLNNLPNVNLIHYYFIYYYLYGRHKVYFLDFQ